MRKDLQPQFSTLYVRTCGMIIVTYIVFGALNWAAYGNWTETVLTVNLHPSSWKVSVQLAYVLAVVFTFPLQLFPAIQILKSVGRKWKRARARCGSPRGYATVDNPLATTAPGGEPRPADEPPSRPRRPTMDAVPEIESSPESPDGPPRLAAEPREEAGHVVLRSVFRATARSGRAAKEERSCCRFRDVPPLDAPLKRDASRSRRELRCFSEARGGGEGCCCGQASERAHALDADATRAAR